MDEAQYLESRELGALIMAMAELGPDPHRSGDIAQARKVHVKSIGPMRASLIQKGMIFSPAHGDLAFTVPLFDEFMKRRFPLSNHCGFGCKAFMAATVESSNITPAIEAFSRVAMNPPYRANTQFFATNSLLSPAILPMAPS